MHEERTATYRGGATTGFLGATSLRAGVETPPSLWRGGVVRLAGGGGVTLPGKVPFAVVALGASGRGPGRRVFGGVEHMALRVPGTEHVTVVRTSSGVPFTRTEEGRREERVRFVQRATVVQLGVEFPLGRRGR
jgi:hypothetical protein